MKYRKNKIEILLKTGNNETLQLSFFKGKRKENRREGEEEREKGSEKNHEKKFLKNYFNKNVRNIVIYRR